MRSLTHLAAALLIGTAVSAGAGVGHAQTVQLTYVQPLSSGAVQMVQQRLRQAGDYTGSVDGVWGPDSVTALQRYQQTHGLQATGELNEATAASLGLQPGALLEPSVAARAPAPVAASTLSADAVATMQRRLRDLGFYRGGIDGVWGPGTEAAIENFQQSRGLQPTGQINPTTVTALGLNPDSLFAMR